MITVRKATTKEMKVIAPMARKLWDHVRKLSVGVDRVDEDMALVKDFEKLWIKWVNGLIASHNGTVIIAESDGRILGYSFGYIMRRMPFKKLRKVGYIDDFYVIRGKRALGIGLKLNKEILKWFKSRGIRHVYLDVIPQNEDAHESYRRWGFKDSTLTMHQRI